MQSNGKGHNGSGTMAAAGATARAITPAPAAIAELASACVKFVRAAVGIDLDYEPETLPILDHYLEEGRKATRERPETAALVAHAAGAYFGEVVRRQHASWWRMEGDDPSMYRIELKDVFLSFCPVQLMADALLRAEADDEKASEGEGEAAIERIEVGEEDRQAVEERLAELPSVSEREFYAPSTRLEVIDIAVDAIRARRMAEGDAGDADLSPEDYEQ